MYIICTVISKTATAIASSAVVVLNVKYSVKVSDTCESIGNQLHYITHVEPEMFDITKIVIPKIMNQWEYIAEALRYDLAIIEAIKVKEGRDPKKCCREFFKDWLMTNNGAKAGPKVWSTLLDTLKKVDEIASDITEDIIAKVKQLKKLVD